MQQLAAVQLAEHPEDAGDLAPGRGFGPRAAGLQVRADSPYKTANDLVAAIKANPGKFKASGTGQGGIWHLAIAGMLKDLKVDPAAAPWVPSNGAAPGCRISSPAASRSCRARCRKRAR